MMMSVSACVPSVGARGKSPHGNSVSLSCQSIGNDLSEPLILDFGFTFSNL